MSASGCDEPAPAPERCACAAPALELSLRCAACHRELDAAARVQSLVEPCRAALQSMLELLAATPVSSSSSTDACPPQQQQQQQQQVTVARYREVAQTTAQTVAAAFGAFFEPEIAAARAAEQQERRRVERAHLVRELASTEAEYHADMQTVLELWMPAVERGGFFEGGKQLSTIFLNVPQIVFLSNELAKALADAAAKPAPEQDVGAVLLRKVPFLRMYVEQCCGLAGVTELVNRAALSPRFAAMQRQVAADPRAKGLDLLGFLIKPTQRLTRYPLLLQSLIKCTDPTHRDYPSLVKALDGVRKVLAEVNENSKLRTSLSLFSRLQARMVWTSRPIDFVLTRALLVCSEGVPWELCKYKSEHSVVLRGNHIIITNMFVVLTDVGTDSPKQHEKKTLYPQELAILPGLFPWFSPTLSLPPFRFCFFFIVSS